MTGRTLPLLPLSLLLAAAAPCLPQPGNDRPPAATSDHFPQRRSDRFTPRDGLPARNVRTIWLEGDIVHALTAGGAVYLKGEKWRPGGGDRPLSVPASLRLPRGAIPASSARTPDGRTWIATNQGGYVCSGDTWRRVEVPRHYRLHQPQVEPDVQLSAVAADRHGTVWWGTNAGIVTTDGADWWEPLGRHDGMPYEDVTCLALGSRGDLWAGTSQGVCRYSPDGGWQYYWGPRWVPGNHVNSIAAAPDGSAWAATDGGVAHLYDVPTTLEEKAAHYEGITRARHARHGFVTGSRLKSAGRLEGGVVYEASDNDALWTSLYLGAQCYRYAVTHDPAARAAARESLGAMLDLARLSGVPGFPARALIFAGETVDGYDANETVRVPGETEKIWYRSPVDGTVLCKGDTSSDELDGHYFALSLYYDLVAGEAEKERIRAAVRAMTDNILEHGLKLVGHTGRPTLWGIWDPVHLNADPAWWDDRGLNSLEILSYLRAADHVCGDARYAAKYRELVEHNHYLLNAIHQKVTEPWWNVNHSDDQLAFLSYYTLARLEKDADTRRLLLLSLERSWKAVRTEASPLFDFIYGAVSGRRCDGDAAGRTLEDWPWELIDWEVHGSQRQDLQMLERNGPARTARQADRVLPASERPLMRWNGNPFECDGGSPDGRHEEDGSAWLLPYWMGRYYRLLPPLGESGGR